LTKMDRMYASTVFLNRNSGSPIAPFELV
jgi:hypothetical protein